MNLFDKTTKNAIAYKTAYVNPEQHNYYKEHKHIISVLLNSYEDFTFWFSRLYGNQNDTDWTENPLACLNTMYSFCPFDREKNDTPRKQYNRYKKILEAMNKQARVRTEINIPAICCVYLAFSKDGALIKIGSSKNLAQRSRGYATDVNMNNHGGIGDIYYYSLNNERTRYFMEDVLRAVVAQTPTAIKLHAADRFVLKGEVEDFKEANFARIDEVLNCAEQWLANHEPTDKSLEEFFQNCPMI